MPEIQWDIFTFIVTQVETPLVAAVVDVTNAFLAFIATPIKVALVLYVALTGVLILRGQIDEAGSTIVSRFLKMALVVWVLVSPGIYQQYVYDFFFSVLPQALSMALTSSEINPIEAHSFDKIWMNAWRGGLEVWKALTWTDIAAQAVVVVYWLAAVLSTVFSFAIWLISRVLLALYIALGPLLIVLALFAATRAVFERWIGSLISCVILQITTMVLLYVVLSVEAQLVAAIGKMGSADAVGLIHALLAGVIFFAVAGFVAFQLPGVASSLAGGLHFHTGSIGRAIRHQLSGRDHRYGSSYAGLDHSGRSGALPASQQIPLLSRGAAVVGSAIGQRIRPATGGSLSDTTRR